ncbi:uncharacterized protein LOC100198147 [Hydra vulgaris]|uniref:uncharacterized protein LOC100198147 n=1 Tax=Hydra vulgaris TaxID=6087 RepID=UPI00019276F7|nr:uncharacterized protein LOC100198147 [Hydra vulgaris]XP_047144119.1 uncharacterized protein LOC100198147 [Hydra vulgaris]XP_047144120.1 uncharacterized protein LOC100198147 [Hydra vulgaris]
MLRKSPISTNYIKQTEVYDVANITSSNENAINVTVHIPHDTLDKSKGNLFLIVVVVSFCVFFGGVIAYVMYNHYREVMAKKREEEALQKTLESGQATISKKTSLVGGGQKQLIIERKVSVNARKISTGSRGLCSGESNVWSSTNSHALNYLRSLSESSTQNISDSNQRKMSISPKVLPANLHNNYLENVLVRYRDGSTANTLKSVSDAEESDEDQDILQKISLESNYRSNNNIESFQMQNDVNDAHDKAEEDSLLANSVYT